MNNVDISISRAFHDYLLGYNEGELNRMYQLHKVKWSIGGPTFKDVGNWHRAWLQAEHVAFIQAGKETGIDLLIRYRN